MEILSLIWNGLKEIAKHPLLGEISVYCKKCEEIEIIGREERKKLKIYNVRKDLKFLRCPGCGIPYGENFYMINLDKE